MANTQTAFWQFLVVVKEQNTLLLLCDLIERVILIGELMRY